MKQCDLVNMLEKSEHYEQGVTVLKDKAIERAMVKVGAAHMRFLDLPVNIRNKVIAIAQMEGW